MKKKGVIVDDELPIFFIRINGWWTNGNSNDVYVCNCQESR